MVAILIRSNNLKPQQHKNLQLLRLNSPASAPWVSIMALTTPITCCRTRGQKFILQSGEREKRKKVRRRFIHLLKQLFFFCGEEFKGGGEERSLLTSLIYVYRPSSPTGSQWSSGSAKQKYIKTTREGIGSAQLKHICPGGGQSLLCSGSGGGGCSSGVLRQYIWEMESSDRLLINKHIGLHQTVTHSGRPPPPPRLLFFLMPLINFTRGPSMWRAR